MGRYRVVSLGGLGEKLGIGKGKTGEAASFQDALERFTHWPAAEACEQSPACAQHPGANLCHMEAWEVFPVGESCFWGRRASTLFAVSPLFPNTPYLLMPKLGVSGAPPCQADAGGPVLPKVGGGT